MEALRRFWGVLRRFGEVRTLRGPGGSEGTRGLRFEGSETWQGQRTEGIQGFENFVWAKGKCVSVEILGVLR